MVPTLPHGDRLLVRYGDVPWPDDLALVRLPAGPDGAPRPLAVKRARLAGRRTAGGSSATTRARASTPWIAGRRGARRTTSWRVVLARVWPRAVASCGEPVLQRLQASTRIDDDHRATTSTRSSSCTAAARSRSVRPSGPRRRDELALAYTPGVGRGLRGDRRRPRPGRRLHLAVATSSPSSPTARPCSGSATSARAAALPVMEGKALLFKEFGGVDAVPICLDTTRRRRDRRRPSSRSRPSSAASTSRTSARRAASRSSAGCRSCSTSRSSTTTSTAPRSSCSPRCATRPPVTGRKLGRPAGRRLRRRRGRRRGHRDPARGRRRRDRRSPTARASCTPDRTDLTDVKQRARRAHEPRRAAPARSPTRSRAPTCSSASRPARCPRSAVASMADGRDRLRAGQPGPRDRTPTSPRGTPPSSRPGAATSRTRSTTCWPSPASSAARSIGARDPDHRRA